MENQKVKNCPFCGEALLKKEEYWLHPANDCFLAICDPEYGNIAVFYDQVDAWNRRFDDEPVDESI